MLMSFFAHSKNERNVDPTRTLIQLIQERSVIQSLSSEQMREKFSRYNLELEEVLIGTPGSSSGDSKIEQILTQLRARQIAEEQIETYNRQEKAAVKERELREAESRAAATGADRVGDRYCRSNLSSHAQRAPGSEGSLALKC
jgi:uncharacterized membrane protein YqiK